MYVYIIDTSSEACTSTCASLNFYIREGKVLNEDVFVIIYFNKKNRRKNFNEVNLKRFKTLKKKSKRGRK